MTAIIAALERPDAAALDTLLGPGGNDLFASGDAEADANTRTMFLAEYRIKHALAARDDGSRVLVVGSKEWPLPIPVVASNGNWYLDGAAGAEEIVFRRIGHNELGTIAVCRTYIEAQKLYASEGHDGNPPGVFADKLLSARRTHNGLYWPNPDGKPASPAAMAVTGIPDVPGIPLKLLYDLAPKPGDEREPLHGYYYRMLFAQGAHANGGARDYVVDGRLTGGTALLARPSEYGVTGAMSFMVNHEGIVFEKDFGVNSAGAVDAINTFDPDSSWTIVI